MNYICSNFLFDSLPSYSADVHTPLNSLAASFYDDWQRIVDAGADAVFLRGWGKFQALNRCYCRDIQDYLRSSLYDMFLVQSDPSNTAEPIEYAPRAKFEMVIHLKGETC